MPPAVRPLLSPLPPPPRTALPRPRCTKPRRAKLETTAPPPTPRSRGDCLPTRLSQPRLWRWAAKHRPHSYGCWRPPTCHRPLTLLIRRPLRLMELRVVLWRPRAGTFSGHKNLWFNPHRRFLLLEEFVILFCYLVIVRTQTNAPGGHPILTGTQLYMKMCKLMNIRCLPQILIETEKRVRGVGFQCY